MSVSQLKKDIKNNRFSHSYVFYGAERYLKEYYFALARRTFTGGDPLNLNCAQYDAKTLDPDELGAVADSYPVMSDRRLIIINDLAASLCKGPLKSAFSSLLSDMPEYLTLFFNYSDPDYSPASSAELKALFSGSLFCEFSRPFERDLIVWIKKNVEAAGKTISDDAVRRLLSDVSRDMSVLKHEIAKLCAYAPKKEISSEDIDAVCITTAEAHVFSLGDAIIFSRADSAYKMTDTLMRQNREQPIAILAYLTSVFSNLLKLSAAKKAGVPLDAAAKEIGYRGSIISSRRLISRADEHTLKSLITMCRDADFKMKDSRVSPEVVMELFLTEALMLTEART
ncbi:MAG: DNA polymerase III subunit delta [Clostridia bacterium]|nr:DNA polymerase III subunit delta [Clostridia bacterium]